MRALYTISLPTEDPTWVIRSCGFTEEVDLWTRDWDIYEVKTVTLHDSVNWQPNNVLSTLEQGLADNGQTAKFMSSQNGSILNSPHSSLDPLLSGQDSPRLQDETSRPASVILNTGSYKITRETLLNFLTILDTTNKFSVALINTLTASTQRDRACAYQPVKNPPEISQLHSR